MQYEPDIDTRMPEQILNYLWLNVLLKEEHGACMVQVIEPDEGKFRRILKPARTIIDLAGA